MAQHSGLAQGWYYRLLGEEFGPVSKDVLDGLITDGQLGGTDEVRQGDGGEWRTVRNLSSGAETNGNMRSTDGTTFSLESLTDAGMDFSSLESGAEAPAAVENVTQESWFYQSLGQDWGPFTFDELLEHARQGDIGREDLIRLGGKGRWRKAESMGRLAAVLPYAVREAKTIPIGKKSAETDDELDFNTPLKQPGRPAAPAPVAAAPPPPPPAPPPQMMPVPSYPGYAPAYMPQPMAPAWGYNQPAAPVNDQGWYAWLAGVECGPMDYAQFANWGQSGRISENDYVKQGKYSQWTLAKTIPGLVAAPVAAPPKPAPAPVAAPAAPAVAVAAPAPAAKPAVQLPAPAPKPAPAPVAAAPAPTPAAASPSSPPESRYEPPAPRPPGADWGSSSVMSTYRPGMATGPAAKKSTPAKSKSKGKSSSGGGVDIGALLKDVRVLGGLGVVVLGVGIYFGIGLLPEGTGALVKAHKDLTGIHKELEGKADSMPTDKKELESFTKSIKAKTKKIKDTFAKSKNPAKSPLNGAASALDSAAAKSKADEVKAKLEEADKKLDDAKKKLKI